MQTLLGKHWHNLPPKDILQILEPLPILGEGKGSDGFLRPCDKASRFAVGRDAVRIGALHFEKSRHPLEDVRNFLIGRAI